MRAERVGAVHWQDRRVSARGRAPRAGEEAVTADGAGRLLLRAADLVREQPNRADQLLDVQFAGGMWSVALDTEPEDALAPELYELPEWDGPHLAELLREALAHARAGGDEPAADEPPRVDERARRLETALLELAHGADARSERFSAFLSLRRPSDGALSWEVDWFDPDQRLVVLHALEPEDALAATASWLQGRGEPEPPHPGGWRRVAAWLRAGGPG